MMMMMLLCYGNRRRVMIVEVGWVLQVLHGFTVNCGECLILLLMGG